MKKKAIEQVPFMGAEPVNTEENYLAKAAVVEVKGEAHLFVEIYTNEAEPKPQMRICFTDKDWGFYYPEKGKWSVEQITDVFGQLIWKRSNKNGDDTFISEQEQTLIKEWSGKQWAINWTWIDILKSKQRDIKQDRGSRKYRRRQEKLQERQEKTPKLPEKMEEWADKEMFGKKAHFLYYKRNKTKAELCCSACGAVMTVKTARGQTLESVFETVYQVPVQNETGICPNCGIIGVFKPKGLVDKNGIYGLAKYCFVGSPYGKNGVVLQHVEITKTFNLHQDAEGRMLGAEEKYCIFEIARKYIEPGRKSQTDFCKYDPYSGKNFWDDCNLYGLSNIKINKGIVHPSTWKGFENTYMKYSGAKEYGMIDEFNLFDYAEQYLYYPQLEMVVKMHLKGVADSIINGRCGIISSVYANRIDEFLGIRKERVKMLQSSNGDLDLLDVLKREKNLGERWTDTQIEFVKEVGAYKNYPLENMSMQQFMNRVVKYAGTTILSCQNSLNMIKSAADTYIDYLNMRRQLGYDMTNTIYLFPRSLKEAHDKMVYEINKAEIDKRISEVTERYPDIQRNYRKLRNKYFYMADGYVIRPANSAKEIVQEGRRLHHCVGGNGYLDKHNRGESYILFLRQEERQEIPYITVEIRNETIIQWYGAYDKKPNQKNMDRWLNKYLKFLKMGIPFKQLEMKEAV